MLTIFQDFVFLWIPTVLLFTLICSFFRIRQTLCRSFSRNERKLAGFFDLPFRDIDDVFLLNNSKFVDLLIASIPLSLKSRIPHIQLGMLHILNDISKLTVRAGSLSAFQ